MEPFHAFLLGLLVAWTPCLLIIGWLMWRAPLVDADPARKGRPDEPSAGMNRA